jgi:hypothetical protein
MLRATASSGVSSTPKVRAVSAMGMGESEVSMPANTAGTIAGAPGIGSPGVTNWTGTCWPSTCPNESTIRRQDRASGPPRANRAFSAAGCPTAATAKAATSPMAISECFRLRAR